MKQYNKITKKTILQLQKGKEKAFVKVYNFYKDKIYFMALNLVKDKYLAEDIVQETFIKVLCDIKGLRHYEAFHVWILRIAYRTCLDKLNKKSYIFYEEYSMENI